PCYGLAEATLFVTGVDPSSGIETFSADAGALEQGRVLPAAGPDRSLVSCGHAWGDTEVVIVDPATGTRCPEDRVGEIWVSGSSVTGGYWGRASETQQTFQARLDGAPGAAFLRTGDLGYLHGGDLYVTGRLKDLVIIDGRNVYPQDIEQLVDALRSHVA